MTALTQRERETLGLLANGLRRKEIAALDGIGFHGMRWRCRQIQRKLGTRNDVHSVAVAFRAGLFDLKEAR